MLLRYQYYRSKHVLYQEVMPVVGGDNPSSATRPILGHLPSAQETRDEIAKSLAPTSVVFVAPNNRRRVAHTGRVRST